MLYYEVTGTGAPLLLVAGVGSDHLSWLGITRALAARFRVITFDNRGCGRSHTPAGDYSIRRMADDTVRLLDHLGVDRCHLLGHSMGGFIAQELAIRYPARVDRLILEGTSPVSTERNNALLRNLLIRRQATADLAFWIRQWAFWLFSPRTFERRTFIETFVKNAAAHPHPQHINGLRGQIEAIAAFDARERLKKIKAKTLIVSAADDILITSRESAALKAIPKSKMVILPDLGHCMHFEDPSAFAQAVTSFLRDKRSRA